MKTGSIVYLILFVAAAVLTLAQMWFSALSAEVFMKVLLTLVFVVALGITSVKKRIHRG